MQLTRYTDYALRVLVYLGSAESGTTASAAEIAKFYGISRNHLSKVVSMLSEQELVIAARGRGGGIRLSVDPKDLCIGDLVRQTENLSLVECFNLETNTCPIASDCTLERLLQDASKAFLAVLDKMTLADLLPASQALQQIRLTR